MLAKDQLARSVAYNKSQLGKLWDYDDLPAAFKGVDAGSENFANLVAAHQQSKGIKVDGALGPGTLKTFATFDDTHSDPHPAAAVPSDAYIQEIVKVAKSKIGVRETGGSNRGPDVDAFIKNGGADPASQPPWCQFFAYWVYSTAAKNLGKKTSAPKVGSASGCWHSSAKSGSMQISMADVRSGKVKLQPGDQMIRVRGKKPEDVPTVLKGGFVPGHTGVVVAVGPDRAYTVEGNTNAAGSREGDGVYEKSILFSSDILVGFVRHKLV